MTTSTTKTKALCVATRCTTVEQFVATFHRFCGDDETFFVATPTSRPIGLETPFSIELADKQPVLRGLCIVLDAWVTPDNRYRRPGIRLGIKRLTADSQVVFDRLKAARSPAAVAEATPPPGPVPMPQLASGTRQPGSAGKTVASPPLPPLPGPGPRPVGGTAPAPPREPGRPLVMFVPPREPGPASAPRLAREPVAAPVPSPPLAREPTPPPVVAVRPALPGVPPAPEAKPVLPSVPPASEARPVLPSALPPVAAKPVLPSALPPVAAKPVLPSVPPASEARPVLPSALPSVAAKPAPPSVPSPAEAKPATPPVVQAPPAVPVGEANPRPAPAPPAAPAAPAPIQVTRFQVALHVDASPPPITDIEFNPQQLVPRKRPDPILVGISSPAEASNQASNDALPAVIMDPQMNGPEGLGPYDILPNAASGRAGGPDGLLRAPGSDLVLPANPLQDLSDESLEGFVDCTIYEDTTLFPSGADSSAWGDPPAAPPPIAPQRSSVPALPFDAAPNLTVRALGDTESLAVAPDDPALTRAVSGELRSDARDAAPRVASGELKVDLRASGPEVVISGELWSDARGPAPEAALPRTQSRPETPLPRPASDAPLDPLDPASRFDSVSLPHGGAVPAWPQPPVDPAFAPGMPMAPGFAPAMAVDPAFAPAPGFAPAMAVDPAFAPGMPMSLPGHEQPFAASGAPGASGSMMPAAAMPPFTDGAPYPRYSTADLVALPGAPVARARPEWQRLLLIVGSVIVAIAVAFVIARLVRGPARAAPPAGPSHATDAPARPPPAPSAAAVASPSQGAAGSVESDPAADAADAADAVPEDDGEAISRGPSVVGSGPCRFTVATMPAGSVVRFDDQPMGQSPITIQGSCDRHKVDISHARYQSVAKWVTLTADKPQGLDISLPRPIHAVTVTSFPPGAELSIDGRRAGTTPAVVQVAGFATVHLTFTKPGFRTVTKKVYSRLAQDRVFAKLMK